ncbi:unnamed protein product [Strongylus vulgaris]|uniref:Iron hydrogenase large subunit C-terminal domain-containing protein n=1 Tax=Strongylus vulgaris TaxID=40348 RepID=A0A3P7LL46_STRVU|nr:unnamed protein product [Strongylus vulgaris]
MMCFDKKLEASRRDFYVTDTEIRETDCVISTVELDSLLDEVENLVESEEQGWLGDFSRGLSNGVYFSLFIFPCPGVLCGNAGGTSGGFADVLVERFVKECGGEIAEQRIARNVDSITVTRDGEVLLRAARIYGFRNIQNLVRKMKNNKTPYDYIEVMACPSACGNGGAQIRGETAEERERILKAVEETFAKIGHDASSEARLVFTNYSVTVI